MSELINAQKLELEEIINRVRPKHQSIQQFEGGDNRNVFVVDGVEAFRFPKNKNGFDANDYEFKVL